MPSKRPSPLENPPSATSSDSSEVEASQEEETTPPKLSSKKHNSNSNPTPITKSHPSSSDEEDDDSGDDSDSDPDVPVQNHTNSSAPLDIKPISSKPMVESSKPKKSTTVEPTSGSEKRKLETDDKDSSRKDKKKKNKVSDLVEEDEEEEEDEAERKSGDEQKKLFQRLWSDDDEIVILKGINSFKKKGMDPSAQVTAFFEFIKESLRPGVNKVQLHSKIRGLKRKYYNASKRVVKNRGEDPKFSKPHEAKVYQLSKKAWGEEVFKDVDGDGKSVDMASPSATDAKKSKNKKINDGVAASPPNPKVTQPLINSPVAVKVEDGENSSEYAYMNGSLRSVSSLPIPPPALLEVFLNRGWDAIGTVNAKRFDQRWKDVMISETKAYLARIELVKEQTQMMLGVLESLNH